MAGRRCPAVGLRPHVLALRGEAAALLRPAAGILGERLSCSIGWPVPVLLGEDVKDGPYPAVCRAEEQPPHIDALVDPVGVSLLDALPVVDHEDAGAASVQKVPVEWIEALLACRVQPPEEKALPPFVEVARGGVDLRLLRPARGPGAASEEKPARAAKPRRQRGVCCGIASYGWRAVMRQRIGMIGGHRYCRRPRKSRKSDRAAHKKLVWPQQSFGGSQQHTQGHELLHTSQQAVAPSGHDEVSPSIQRRERLGHHLIRRLLVAWRPIGFDA